MKATNEAFRKMVDGHIMMYAQGRSPFVFYQNTGMRKKLAF